MRKLIYVPATFLLILQCSCVFAQKKAIKFGDIKVEDFEPKVYAIDSNANAVILSDVGSSKYEGNNKSNFNVVFKRHTRIRILNRNGFDVASFSIPMYAEDNNDERIESLEANTYNLENGKVEVTKLDRKSMFKDRLSQHWTTRKFTMPNLKEGCIIELKYTFISPYAHYLRSWEFQKQYPTLRSQYKTSVPTIFDFITIGQGYHPYAVKTADLSKESYNILVGGESASESSRVVNVSSNVINTTWAMENVPGLKKENFTTTIDNYVSKIEFQLSKLRYPDQQVKDVLNNWMQASEELMKDSDFGESLTKSNNWLNDDMKKIVGGTTNKVEIARKIYAYVRDNFTCISHSNKYLSSPLKKIFQSKSGNVADINILLTAMLLQQGLDAHPVLLSTREHGKVYELYPVMDQLNYVISRLIIDEKEYLLDASYNKLGFGHLASECYNGYARVIDKTPILIPLSADSLKEQKLTSVFIIEDEKQGLSGTYTSMLGYHESLGLRESFSKTSKDDLFKNIKKGFLFDVDVTNGTVDSLEKYEEPVSIKYDFKFKFDDDIIYLNPVLTDAVKENPFKAAERLYPVEMPYAMNECFVLKMEVPKGYKVEEMPKSVRVKLNDDEGMFEYMIANSEGEIQLRSVIKLNKATYLPEDYQTLRDFYAFVVKKQSEQIVLKKIK